MPTDFATLPSGFRIWIVKPLVAMVASLLQFCVTTASCVAALLPQVTPGFVGVWHGWVCVAVVVVPPGVAGGLVVACGVDCTTPFVLGAVVVAAAAEGAVVVAAAVVAGAVVAAVVVGSVVVAGAVVVAGTVVAGAVVVVAGAVVVAGSAVAVATVVVAAGSVFAAAFVVVCGGSTTPAELMPATATLASIPSSATPATASTVLSVPFILLLPPPGGRRLATRKRRGASRCAPNRPYDEIPRGLGRGKSYVLFCGWLLSHCSRPLSCWSNCRFTATIAWWFD
jgi:hypothetical protein